MTLEERGNQKSHLYHDAQTIFMHGEHLEPVQMKIPTENWAYVGTKPKCVEHWQQIEQSQICRIGKPWLYWNSII